MATNEEGTIERKETASELMLAALEKLKIEVAGGIQNDNKQSFAEITDRLTLIEASVSEIAKSIGNAQKSKGASWKAYSALETTNTIKVASSRSKKQFKLKHVFKDVSKFQENVEHYSEKEDHYNTNWSMGVQRHNNNLGFYVHCDPITPADNWSIQTKTVFKVVGPNQNDVIRTWDICYQKNTRSGFYEFMGWENMKNLYLVDGNLTVEVNVDIDENTVFSKPKIRKFDESQKNFSDVILVVEDTKFYVSKMFLAAQSSVFNALLLGNFFESKQSEVTLNGVDPDDFHYFLEVLYGESAIDDTTVEGVALLADMYDAPTVIRRCEEFLLKESKKTVEMKQEIAARYNLENLKENCRMEITYTMRKVDLCF